MKIFKYIGLCSLLLFSVFISNETKQVVKEKDEIMIQIKKEYKKYNIERKESIIINDTIIIGSKGYIVNINKSYDNMKKYGKYNKDLYIYKSLNIKKPKDKYIIGFDKITLIFKINNINEYNNIKIILDNNDVVGNFYSINDKYNDNVINKKYCYTENLSNLCKNKYTINPMLIVRDNPLYNVKKNITNNSIISFEYNKKLKEELPLIITYIKNRGYEIDSIDNMLK